MVRVTLEFPSIDQAIIGLGKLVSTAPSKGKPQSRSVAVTAPVPAAGASSAEAVTPSVAVEPVKQASPKKPRKPRADAGKPRGSYKKSTVPPGAPVTIEAPASTPAAQPAPQPEVQTQPEPSPGDVQSALESVFNVKGLAAAQALLKQFGATLLRELDPSKYADFVAAARAEVQS